MLYAKTARYICDNRKIILDEIEIVKKWCAIRLSTITDSDNLHLYANTILRSPELKPIRTLTTSESEIEDASIAEAEHLISTLKQLRNNKVQQMELNVKGTQYWEQGGRCMVFEPRAPLG
jgi:hypothetical protein